VWLPNDDYRSITFASRELDAGESWRRRRTVMAEGKVIEGLAGLFGYSDTAAAEMTSTRESVRRFYERTEGLARGEAE
jgi:hypothetical protein